MCLQCISVRQSVLACNIFFVYNLGGGWCLPMLRVERDFAVVLPGLLRVVCKYVQ